MLLCLARTWTAGRGRLLDLPRILGCNGISQTTAYMSTKRRQFRPRHKADGVNTNNDIIYINSNTGYLYSTMFGTMITAYPAFGISLMFTYKAWDTIPDVFFDLTEPVTPTLIMGMAGLLLVEAVRRVFKPAVNRMYYNEDNGVFTVVPLRFFPAKSNLEFTAADVRQKDVSGVLKELTGNYVIKGHNVYIQIKDFKHRSYFNLLTEEAKRASYREK